MWRECHRAFQLTKHWDYRSRHPRRPDRDWVRSSGRPRNRWIDQLRQDHQRPPADLWQAAIQRGHTGATLRSSTTTRWRRRLLQTEINWNEVYHKLYHHTPNLLLHYLVEWTEMYWPMLLAWFHKDATVEQVVLNVTYMDKINIFSSQAVLDVSSFSADALSKSSSPLVNSLVKNQLFKTTADIDELPF